jgi:hypothetical protein
MDEVQLGGAGGEEQPGHGRQATAADRARTQTKASILLAEGNAHAAAGRFDDAMASMASALAIDPTNLDILDALDECRAMQAASAATPEPPVTPKPGDNGAADADAAAEQTPRAKGREQAARWQEEGYVGAGGAATDTTPAPSPRSEPPLFMREGAGGLPSESTHGATATATEPEPEPTLPSEGTGWAGALGKKMGMSDEMIDAMNAVRLCRR